MVLTKAELITALQKEVGILIHLAQKLDDASTHYRPTAKQRSSLELLRYLTVMGPALVQATKDGKFNPAAWQAGTEHAHTGEDHLGHLRARINPHAVHDGPSARGPRDGRH